ncbi:MAG TPA: hypothetical protein VK672_05625 [Solirubrobacteraceae bacterium]|jgi:hypothetical protein|nr:hypothetical protein [Solirubrobacteraceae bacterium]
MTPRLRKCDESTTAGRLAKAEQFLEGAEIIHEFAVDEQDVADAYVTLCVHCGVAAADAICCIALGEHVQGEDHNQAVAHLAKVRPDGAELGTALRTLLGMKTRAGYSHEHIGTAECKRAQRAAERLLEAARERRISR